MASKINVTPKGVYLPLSKLELSRIDFTFTSLQSAVNCCFCDTYGGNIYFAGDSTPIPYWYIARIFITKTQAPNLFMHIISIGFIVKNWR